MKKENQWPDQTDNQVFWCRNRCIPERKQKQEHGSENQKWYENSYGFLQVVGEFRDPATIPFSELNSLLARFFLGVRKRDFSEYEPDTLYSIHNSIDRYFRDEKLTIR